MQSLFSCHKCLNILEEAVGTRTLWTAFRSVPKRSLSAWTATHRVSSQRNSRPPLAQQRKRHDEVLGWYQGQLVTDEVGRAPILPRPPPRAVSEFQGPVLRPDDLFHSFSNSPIPDIRRRAVFMKTHAYCSHPSHRQTRIPSSPHDLEARKATSGVDPPAHVRFECPDCGIPVSCSEEHWADDYENHLEICDTLRQINEDDHDLRSNRAFWEFFYPGPPIAEALVNMTNWDTYLYTAGYPAINEERSMRQATKLLTYPVTIGSIIHELSPYNIKAGGRLTVEGLKSLTGRYLQYQFHASLLFSSVTLYPSSSCIGGR
jgi:splicing suppressor protein 51